MLFRSDELGALGKSVNNHAQQGQGQPVSACERFQDGALAWTGQHGRLIYTSPFDVSTDLLLGETITVKAVTIHPDMNPSSTVTKVITFLPSQVATPVITTDAVDPDAIVSGTNVDITITTTTPGTSIYFTTDGNDPTELDTAYTGAFSINAPVNIDGTVTIKAIAIGEGMENSEIISLTLTFLEE